MVQLSYKYDSKNISLLSQVKEEAQIFRASGFFELRILSLGQVKPDNFGLSGSG